MSQYVLTDGVDSTTFALREGHGSEKVRIKVRTRDTVYSESEFNEKIHGRSKILILASYIYLIRVWLGCFVSHTPHLAA